MIPKRIELENFLSFGTPAVEIAFTDDEPLWALCGRNGVGKSAIFDAITYALYGQHRGGSQKVEQLIRHGANGFRVVFDFEFAGVDYRITCALAARTVQKVDRLIDGEWQAVVGVNAARQITAWVEKLLGLKFEAFTTSVLLRQGEADKLFSASRDERITVLKGIIGFERFEEISEKVHAATAAKKSAFDGVRRQRDALRPVTPEELAAAESAATDAKTKWELTQAGLAVAAQRVEQAKQWEGLEAKRVDLQRQLAEAAKRAQDAETIRADKARLDDLTAAVPVLLALLALRNQIDGLETKLADARGVLKETTDAVQANATAADEARKQAKQHEVAATTFAGEAKALGEQIEHGTKFLELADAIAELRTRLDRDYPADLAVRLVAVETGESVANEAKQSASNAVAGAKSRLEQAEKQQKRFAAVKGGATCSQCGQKVTAEHAKKERARLASEIRDHQATIDQLEKECADAVGKYDTACKDRQALLQEKTERDHLATEFAAKNASLTVLGGVADAAELRHRLADQQTEKARVESCAKQERDKQTASSAIARQRDADKVKLDALLKTATAEVHQCETALTTSRAQQDARREQLTPAWIGRFPELDRAAIANLASDRDRLQASGVVSRFELLRHDEATRDEWIKQPNGVCAELDGIPFEARLPVKEAQQRQATAKTAAETANGERDAAVLFHKELKARAQERQRLTACLRLAEREHELHARLDELLGQTGLQRELVRDAEQQIVELANDTLQNLSDGDLSLEPDDEATGRDDKAFALRVRRAGDALPIGVAFLSGSQKFRVAVAVALAVGRFASGRSRPLEAVIIDEGFGSLDKDGLRAMADELKRLQRLQSLKRVVLVSHQEEFTGQFPVGYRLEAGDNGTTAKPMRNP